MAKTGRIELYSSWDDKLINSCQYNRISKRQRAIEIWRSRYKNKFYQCYLQIIPDVDDMRINDDGENQYVGRTRTYRQIEKVFKKDQKGEQSVTPVPY